MILIFTLLQLYTSFLFLYFCDKPYERKENKINPGHRMDFNETNIISLFNDSDHENNKDDNNNNNECL